MPTPNPNHIAIACAKSLEDFERDYMPPRSSYALYTTSPKSPDVQAKSYQLSLYAPKTLSSQDLTACLNLIEETSGKHYRGSRQGWNAKIKRSEMGLWNLRYLVVRELELERGACQGVEGKDEWVDVEEGEEGGDGEEEKEEVKEGHGNGNGNEMIVEENEEVESGGEGAIKGFMSFMPTFEDGIMVVYLYEIHLVDELRATGLGTHLMSLLAKIAQAIPGVQKTMLTCFTANEAALGFYKKLGYEKDEYSPEPKRLKGGRTLESDYVILSRRVEREVEGEVEGRGESERGGEEARRVGDGKRKRGD